MKRTYKQAFKKCQNTNSDTNNNLTSLQPTPSTGQKPKIEYSRYFQTALVNNVKMGICTICQSKNRSDIAEVPMKDSNTTGLKRHLLHYHKTEYVELFGSLPKTSLFTMDKFLVVRFTYIYKDFDI